MPYCWVLDINCACFSVTDSRCRGVYNDCQYKKYDMVPGFKGTLATLVQNNMIIRQNEEIKKQNEEILKLLREQKMK